MRSTSDATGAGTTSTSSADRGPTQPASATTASPTDSPSKTQSLAWTGVSDEQYEIYGRCIRCCKPRYQGPDSRWLWLCSDCPFLGDSPIPWNEWEAND